MLSSDLGLPSVQLLHNERRYSLRSLVQRDAVYGASRVAL